MRRQKVSDQEWRSIQPFLPSNEGNPGRNYREHRQMLSGIVWVLRTGAPWRDLPGRFGPWSTAYDRHGRWTQGGLWFELFRRINAVREQLGLLDWSAHFVDGISVRAHQKAAGAPGGYDRLGQSRGGFTTKVHIRVDRDGNLLKVEISEGHRQELPVFEKLMNNGAVPIPSGRPKLRGEAVVGDKGYNASWVRQWAHDKHMAAVIPKYSNQTTKGRFNKDLYRERNLVERKIGQFKEFRRVAFRFEKLSEHYRANWLIAEMIRVLPEIEEAR